MKYAITGHTRGLGAAIVKQLAYGNSYVGFSRSNGYDISNADDRIRIVNEITDCHVFINNAHNGYAQTDMLYDIWNKWQDTNKLIINIGSNTTDGIKSHAHKYTAEKIALEKASDQLANQNKCKVTLFKFGWIGSERVLTNYAPDSYITVNDAAKYIIQTINLTHNYRLVSTTLLPK